MKKRAKSLPPRRHVLADNPAEATVDVSAPSSVGAASQAPVAGVSKKRRSTLFSIRSAPVPPLFKNVQNRFSQFLGSKRKARTDSKPPGVQSRVCAVKRKMSFRRNYRDVQAPKRRSPMTEGGTVGLGDQDALAPARCNSISSQDGAKCFLTVAGCEVARSAVTFGVEDPVCVPSPPSADSSVRVGCPSSRELGCASVCSDYGPEDRANMSQMRPSAMTQSVSLEVHVFMLDFAEILVRCCTCLRNGTTYASETQHDPFHRLATEVRTRGDSFTCMEQLVINDLLRVFRDMQREIFVKMQCNIASQYDVEALEFLAHETKFSLRFIHSVEDGYPEYSSLPSPSAAAPVTAQAAVQVAAPVAAQAAVQVAEQQAEELEEQLFWSPRSSLSRDSTATSKAKPTASSAGIQTLEEARQTRWLLRPVFRETKELVLDPLKAKACENLLTLVVCELGRRSFQMCTTGCTEAPVANAFCDLLQAGLGLDVRDDGVWRALVQLVTIVTGRARQ